MVLFGDGAEGHARSKRYDYRANASLVLASDTRTARDTLEPTGEAETLSGKIDPRSFGDRVYRGKPPCKKRKDLDQFQSVDHRQPKRRGSVREEEGILGSATYGRYQPKTEQTRLCYGLMLRVIEQQLGGQPLGVLCGVADEILDVLKDQETTNPNDKKKKIEKVLLTSSSIPNNIFDELVSIANQITDYQIGRGTDDVMDDPDDVSGVAVDFEEEEEMGDQDFEEDESEDEDDVTEPINESSGSSMRMGGGVDDDMQEANDDKVVRLNAQDIDAYWLQRKISQAYEQKLDPQRCQELSERVLNILAEDNDTEKDVENKLVQQFQFQFDKFSLIRFLLHNRQSIVWCTRLARAPEQDARKTIEEDMLRLGRPDLAAILEQLYASRATPEERQKKLEKRIRKEARLLKDGDHSGSSSSYHSDSAGWFKGQCKLLDLDGLALQQGRLSSNHCCNFPDKIPIYRHSGYDEIHVPGLKAKAFDPEEKLVNVTDMPMWARPAFDGMTRLNRVQSKVYETALFKADNILLCAPTGAGKTNVAVLSILQQIALHMNREDGSINHNNYKIVYVAPMKALVAEVVGNLSNRLQCYGCRVKELSGDQSLTRQEIEETQIIVTTPEKWDIITRKSGERTYTLLVKLVIIDEIHLLHDNRGPVLESIVSRTVRQIETRGEHIRLVGLSATLPNYEDVALFLRVDLRRGLFFFDNSYRPVPLSQCYIGLKVRKPLQRFQLMDDLCYEKVMAVAGKHQVLIFVHSRKETVRTARAIRDTALAKDTLGRFFTGKSASHEILKAQTDLLKSNELKDLVPYGFAIHHAGLNRSDRGCVEKLFAEGDIQVLVSTATLAWGVNLPAHTVIIKGTQIYNPEKGAWTELNPLDVMQMLGRAGRPQYDKCGEGIVITGSSELQYYLSLMNQQLPIESQFVSKLADQLNAEIVLGTVQNAREACNWLAYTYLYIRMLKNPSLYGLEADVLTRDVTLEERRADLIHSAATILDKNNLVKYDRKSGYFQVTDLGRIASYYYITHGTISTYNENLNPTMGDIELCRVFSLSEEFKYVNVRQGQEEMELAKLLNGVPIPIRESWEDPRAKINALLQVYIARLKLEGLSLSSDMVYITQSAGRLLQALFEITLKRGWARLAEKALKWCKMVNKRMWSVQTPLLQFKGIPNDILMKLEKKNLAWERYYDLSSQELGELIRSPKMGRTLHKLIHQIPKLNLAVLVQPVTRTILRIELTLTPDFQWEDKVHGYLEAFWIIVEDNDGECILHHEYFMLKRQYIDEDHTLNFTVPIYEPLPPQYFIRVVSDRWLGSETVLPLSFAHLILPEKFPPPTELLDLQPLPVTALRNPLYEGFYQDFRHFNPIQTQVFAVLYNSDDNVLVAAPTGSGKTICAEFAIMRNHQKGPDSVMRVVYIAPIEALAKERYWDWERKFGKGLNMHVVELTGETTTDLKLLEKGQVIISTPDKWDALSRRWKYQKHVQQVSLFIVDELHLIRDEGGQVLEVIVSRMRYIASQVENRIRIVALSSSIANAKDLGEWIGASTSHGLFNFPPSVRPVPLEIHIQGVDIANFEARMQAMTKPTYTAILQHAMNGKPAIVYVPTKKHVQLTAVDLMTYSNADRSPFILPSLGDFEQLTGRIQDEMLKATLSRGVGYLHEGLASLDQQVVSELYETGRIQVCVMSSSMCWGVPLKAHLVVVMGTQYYDNTDYPITDLLQMMGHACRPLQDSCGKFLILCHAPRKEYYKKFLHEAFPVESHLQHYLHDNLNAEVVAGIIQNKQDAVDYLTWTLMYRRLTQNPSCYNLQGVSHRHLSEHLSEVVENILCDLETSNCIAIENDMDLSPLNLGRIASYYYISYATIERFGTSLTSKTKMKGLLEILASASEYAKLPIRPGEEDVVRRLINHQRFSFGQNTKCTDPHVKANALLQAHFSRQALGGNLALDQREVLIPASRLIQAMVDVVSSNGWLSLALLAMELSQMVKQRMWNHDSVLLQFPHFTKELAKKFHENPPGKSIELLDMVEMEEADRRELFKDVMSKSQLNDVERFCKHFPNIDMGYEVLVENGNDITLQVILEQEHLEGRTEVEAKEKGQAGWWIVVGDTKSDSLLAIKRVSLVQSNKLKVKLKFEAPAAGDDGNKTLFLVSDTYVGCDQEYSFSV